jgi:hypothetical protein
MIRRLGLGVLLVLGLAWCAAASDSLSVYVQTEAGFVQVALGDFPLIEGTVAYEGPAAADGQANWKSAYTYKGVSVAAILASVSGLASYETLGVVAVDGWYKMLPAAVIGGDTAAGTGLGRCSCPHLPPGRRGLQQPRHAGRAGSRIRTLFRGSALDHGVDGQRRLLSRSEL